MLSTTGKIQFAEQDGTFVLKCLGDVRLTLCSALDSTIEKVFAARHFSSIIVDLTDAEGLDSTTLGLLAKVSILSQKELGQVPTLVTTHPDITRLVQSMGFDQVFNIVSYPLPTAGDLKDLPNQSNDINEEAVRQKVLEAHHILMSLNETNQAAFQDLVNGLEGC